MNTRRALILQVRAESATADGEVEATVSVYDRPYPIAPGVRERIARGAFDESLSGRSLPIYHEHGWKRGEAPIGVTTEADTSGDGIDIRGQFFIDDDPVARSVHRSMRVGALRQWSIGFFPVGEDGLEWDETRDGDLVTVRKGDLAEVSTVLRGAAGEAAGTKSVDGAFVRAEDPEEAAEQIRQLRGLRELTGIDLDLSRPEHRELVRARLVV